MRKTTWLLVRTIVFGVLTTFIAVFGVIITIEEGVDWERLLQLAIFVLGVSTTVQYARRWLHARRADREPPSATSS